MANLLKYTTGANLRKYTTGACPCVSSDPRKVYADLYIDARMIGMLPTWDEIYEEIRERLPTYADKVGREGFL